MFFLFCLVSTVPFIAPFASAGHKQYPKTKWFQYLCPNSFPMKEVTDISIGDLSEMAENMYGSFVKAAVDLENEILVVDAELHADEEQYLLERGSKQQHLWGINIYPQQAGTDKFIEFDSMINIRPRQHNMSRGVENPEIREQITALVLKKIQI